MAIEYVKKIVFSQADIGLTDMFTVYHKCMDNGRGLHELFKVTMGTVMIKREKGLWTQGKAPPGCPWCGESLDFTETLAEIEKHRIGL